MIEQDPWEFGCMAGMALIGFIAAVAYVGWWIYSEFSKEYWK